MFALSVGAFLTGLSWVLAASATTITQLYLTCGLFSGVGTGIIYVGVVGLMVGWFPDCRGFATGCVAAGYGMGAILTTFPISDMITKSGYESTLRFFDVIISVIGIGVALGVRRAPVALAAALKGEAQAVASLGPGVMLKNPLFGLLFAMMTMMSTGGLMVISQFSAFAKDFGMGNVLVFGLAALPLAATIDRLCNGLTWPFRAWAPCRADRGRPICTSVSGAGCRSSTLLWRSIS